MPAVAMCRATHPNGTALPAHASRRGANRGAPQHTCGMSTLHVTNGDVVGGTLIQAGFGDAVLPWRDVLHDGPVPGGLDAEALRNVRAQFLAVV